MRTLGERFDPRRNALNFLRLVLAMLVIVSHASPLSGAGPDPELGGITLGTLAVGGFFAISGYLITASRFRTKLTTFAWRRFLRIFPGYWVCLAFTAFVAAWFGGRRRGGWSSGDAWRFVVTSADMHGGSELSAQTLSGAPLAGTWNGSLWTLRFEVACYVLVGVGLTLGLIRRRGVIILAAFLMASVVSVYVHASGIRGVIEEAALLVPFFLAGAVLFYFSSRVRLNAWGALGAITLLGVLAIIRQVEALGALPLAYILLWAAVAAPRALQMVGSKHDFSYGMYLYAFPLQQMLVVVGIQRYGLLVFTLASMLLTMPLAMLSWFVVERPSLKLKSFRRTARRDPVSA